MSEDAPACGGMSAAETEACAWVQGLKFSSPSALVQVDFEFEGSPGSFKRCHDRSFARTDACPLETMPPAMPDISIEEAQTRVKDFAGVEAMIVRTERWRPGETVGQHAAYVLWNVRISARYPVSLVADALSLSGAVEQLKVAVADSPAWKKTRNA